MIAKAFYWMRSLVPMEWVLGFLLLLYLPLEILLLWMLFGCWGVPAWGRHAVVDVFSIPRDLAVAAGMFAYGLYRIVAFHPLYSIGYREWLQRVPWTSRHPLPLGPLHPAPQDLLMVLLGLTLAHNSPAPWSIPLGFLLGQMAAAGAAFWTTGPWAMRYLPLFVAGLMIRFQNSPWLVLGIAAPLYLVMAFATQSALTRFPWQIPEKFDHFLNGLRQRTESRPISYLGWPHDQLSPRVVDWKISLCDGIAISLLSGWLAYALGVSTPKQVEGGLHEVVYMYCLGGCIVVRLYNYCALCWPPISLWGRLRTFRWIIPSYDFILLPSLATAVLSPLTLATLSWAGLPLYYSIPAATTVALAITLNTGPSLRRWQLTGDYRMIPFASLKKSEAGRI